MTRDFAQIAEQRDLLARAVRDRPLAAAQQDVGLDAEAEQFLGRMLGRLGLQLAGRGDPRHQGQVHEHAPARGRVRCRAGGSPRGTAGPRCRRPCRRSRTARNPRRSRSAGDEFLDRVGDVRDHLHRGAEIFAAPLAADHGRIDAAGGDAVALARRDADIALVMAEVEIGLGAVVGDEDLAVLIGAHRAGIDIEIGVELAQAHLEAARLQQRAERRRATDPCRERRPRRR